MATVTPVLRTSKKNEHGQSPIWLRIYANGKTKYHSLGISVKERHWNENKRRVRKPHDQHGHINTLIVDRLSEAEKEILRRQTEGEPVSAYALKKFLASLDGTDEEDDEEEEIDFFAFADEVIEEMERRKQLHTAKRYKSVIRMFKEFAGEPLPFEDLTVQLLNEWETALIEKGNKVNTRATKFRAIRAILNKAIDRGVCPQDIYPFRTFSIKRERTERTRLSLEQIRAMEDLDLEEGTLLWHVRNYFLFSFYCAGIRFRDVATMKRKHVRNGRLKYTMSKTGKVKEMKLVPQAREIVDYYLDEETKQDDFIFPMLEEHDTSTLPKLNLAVSRQNVLINKYLKKIAKDAELPDDLSFHVSRHSFADFARQQDWSVYDISKALAHSNLRVTERYLKGFDAEGLDEKMDSLFGADDENE